MRLFILDDNLSYRSQIDKAAMALGSIEIVGSSRMTATVRHLIESAKPNILIYEYNEMSPALFAELEAHKIYLDLVIGLVDRKEYKTKAQELGTKIIIDKTRGEAGDESRVAGLIGENLHSYLKSKSITLNPSKPKARTQGKWPCRAIVIASSTGGPTALETVFTQLSPPLDIPIFIAQHMPESFTKSLAERLASVSQLNVREAIQGEEAKPGTVYIAPGNFHMRLKQVEKKVFIGLDQGEKIHSVRPAADFLFHTASAIYQRDLVGFVFTGMGADGADGAKRIKDLGGHVVIQDKDSCAVWGMPGATHALGAFDIMDNLNGMASVMRQLMVRSLP